MSEVFDVVKNDCDYEYGFYDDVKLVYLIG